MTSVDIPANFSGINLNALHYLKNDGMVVPGHERYTLDGALVGKKNTCGTEIIKASYKFNSYLMGIFVVDTYLIEKISLLRNTKLFMV